MPPPMSPSLILIKSLGCGSQKDRRKRRISRAAEPTLSPPARTQPAPRQGELPVAAVSVNPNDPTLLEATDASVLVNHRYPAVAVHKNPSRQRRGG